MEQHPAGLSLKTSLPLHEPTAEKEESARGAQRPYHRHVPGLTEVNSLHDAMHCLHSPAPSVAGNSATRYLLNHRQPSKLNSEAPTAVTLITGAGAHTDGSFLWGGNHLFADALTQGQKAVVFEKKKIVVKGICNTNCHLSDSSY